MHRTQDTYKSYADRRRLDRSLRGPFRISEQINPIAYSLELPPEYRIRNVFHVSLLEPVHTTDIRAGMRPASPDDEPDDELATVLNNDSNTGTEVRGEECDVMNDPLNTDSEDELLGLLRRPVEFGRSNNASSSRNINIDAQAGPSAGQGAAAGGPAGQVAEAGGSAGRSDGFDSEHADTSNPFLRLCAREDR
ncbi:hypothetical protein RI367_008539 [Sorochytrium milnesiophthora]